MGSRIDIGTRGRNSTTIGGSAGTPKYVGARAEVIRIPNVGVKIRLTDYKGTTEEVVAEAIESIVTNDNGSLTFTLPDGRTFTTDSLKGDKGDTGDAGLPGNGIDSIEKTGTSGLVDTYTITYDDGDTDTFTVTNGEKGDPGEDGQDGQDGFSPVASVSKSGDTATISITDKNGTTTATVSDGADGQDGSDGADGADGFSPIATVTKSGSTTTISITDKDGTTTEDVYDGVTSYNDLTDKPTIPSKVSDLTNDSGFITTETDPTVPSWAKASTKPAYTAEEVGALPDDTEIPSKTSDLENDSRFIKAVDTASGAIATFKDAFIKKLTAQINPLQDLHGYDKPWAGGNGKNLLPYGTTATVSNVVFTVASDGVVTLSGSSASAENQFSIPFTVTETGDYYFNGCSDGGGNNTFDVHVWDVTNGSRAKKWDGTTNSSSLIDSSSDGQVRLVVGTSYQYRIRIRNGFTPSGQKFYPMVRKSTESATYEPYSNICPISGWDDETIVRTGKNLVCGLIESANVNSSGTISTSTYNVAYARVEAGKTYIVSNVDDSAWVWGFFRQRPVMGSVSYDGSRVVNDKTDSETFTAPIDGYIAVRLGAGTSTCQIELGSIATEYETIGSTYTIDLDGTRYGGTLDVTSGVMVVDMAEVDLGSLNWTMSTGANERFSSAGIKDVVKKPSSNANVANIICSNYQKASFEDIYNHIKIAVSIAENGNIGVYEPNYTDAASFKTAMDGVQLVYELATPLSIDLTPTQIEAIQGSVNNVWASTGNVELELVGVPEMADKIPFAPTTDGTYTLKVTITDGEAAYSWVADE